MNLIEQLKQTPKWNEFEQWWENIYGDKIEIGESWNDDLRFSYWCDFPFEFQEGVFKKYLEQDSVIAKYRTHWNISVLKEDYSIQEDFYTFEELIFWYFNN